METTTIAKSADSVKAEAVTIDIDVANMSWADAHEFVNNNR